MVRSTYLGPTLVNILLSGRIGSLCNTFNWYVNGLQSVGWLKSCASYARYIRYARRVKRQSGLK